MIDEDEIFSAEYQTDTSTRPDKQVEEEAPMLERQLESQIQAEVQIYGTGKPRRDVIRAKIVND